MTSNSQENEYAESDSPTHKKANMVDASVGIIRDSRVNSQLMDSQEKDRNDVKGFSPKHDSERGTHHITHINIIPKMQGNDSPYQSQVMVGVEQEKTVMSFNSHQALEFIKMGNSSSKIISKRSLSPTRSPPDFRSGDLEHLGENISVPPVNETNIRDIINQGNVGSMDLHVSPKSSGNAFLSNTTLIARDQSSPTVQGQNYQTGYVGKMASSKKIAVVTPNKVSVQIQQLSPVESARNPFNNHHKNETVNDQQNIPHLSSVAAKKMSMKQSSNLNVDSNEHFSGLDDPSSTSFNVQGIQQPRWQSFKTAKFTDSNSVPVSNMNLTQQPHVMNKKQTKLIQQKQKDSRAPTKVNIGARTQLPFGELQREENPPNLLVQKPQFTTTGTKLGTITERDRNSIFKNYMTSVHEQIPTEYAGKSFKATLAPKNMESVVAKQKVQNIIKVDQRQYLAKERNSSQIVETSVLPTKNQTMYKSANSPTSHKHLKWSQEDVKLPSEEGLSATKWNCASPESQKFEDTTTNPDHSPPLSYRITMNKFDRGSSKEKSTYSKGYSKEREPTKGDGQEAIKIIVDEKPIINMNNHETLQIIEMDSKSNSRKTSFQQPPEQIASLIIEPKPISAYVDDMNATKKLRLEQHGKPNSYIHGGNSAQRTNTFEIDNQGRMKEKTTQQKTSDFNKAKQATEISLVKVKLSPPKRKAIEPPKSSSSQGTGCRFDTPESRKEIMERTHTLEFNNARQKVNEKEECVECQCPKSRPDSIINRRPFGDISIIKTHSTSPHKTPLHNRDNAEKSRIRAIVRELNMTKNEQIQEAKGLNFNQRKQSMPKSNKAYITSRAVQTLFNNQQQKVGYGTNKFTGGRLNFDMITSGKQHEQCVQGLRLAAPEKASLVEIIKDRSQKEKLIMVEVPQKASEIKVTDELEIQQIESMKQSPIKPNKQAFNASMFKTSRAPRKVAASKSQLSQLPGSSHMQKKPGQVKRESHSVMGQTERMPIQNRIQLQQLNATVQSTQINDKESSATQLQHQQHSRHKAQTSMTGYGSNPRPRHYVNDKSRQSHPDFQKLTSKHRSELNEYDEVTKLQQTEYLHTNQKVAASSNNDHEEMDANSFVLMSRITGQASGKLAEVKQRRGTDHSTPSGILGEQTGTFIQVHTHANAIGKGVKTIKLQLPSVINSRDEKRQPSTPGPDQAFIDQGNASPKGQKRKLLQHTEKKDMPTSTMNVDSIHSTTSVMGQEVRDNEGTLQKKFNTTKSDLAFQQHSSIDQKESAGDRDSNKAICLNDVPSQDGFVNVMLPPIIQSVTPKPVYDSQRGSVDGQKFTSNEQYPKVTWREQASPKGVRFMYDLRIAAAQTNPQYRDLVNFTLQSQAIQIAHENPNTVRRQYMEQLIHKQDIIAKHNRKMRDRNKTQPKRTQRNQLRANQILNFRSGDETDQGSQRKIILIESGQDLDHLGKKKMQQLSYNRRGSKSHLSTLRNQAQANHQTTRNHGESNMTFTTMNMGEKIPSNQDFNDYTKGELMINDILPTEKLEASPHQTAEAAVFKLPNQFAQFPSSSAQQMTQVQFQKHTVNMGLPTEYNNKEASTKTFRSRKKLLMKSPRDDIEPNPILEQGRKSPREESSNQTSQHLFLSQANIQIGETLATPKIKQIHKRNSELELGSVSPWKQEQVMNPTMRISKNSNQIWGSKKIIHEIISPGLKTGMKEEDEFNYHQTSPNKQELNFNLNERSVASILEDNLTLLDERSRADPRLTANKTDQSVSPIRKTLLKNSKHKAAELNSNKDISTEGDNDEKDRNVASIQVRLPENCLPAADSVTHFLPVDGTNVLPDQCQGSDVEFMDQSSKPSIHTGMKNTRMTLTLQKNPINLNSRSPSNLVSGQLSPRAIFDIEMQKTRLQANGTTDKSQGCNFQEQMQMTGQRFPVLIKDTNVIGVNANKIPNQDIAHGVHQVSPAYTGNMPLTLRKKSSVISKNHSIESIRSLSNRKIIKPCDEKKLQELDAMREKLDKRLQVGSSQDTDEINWLKPSQSNSPMLRYSIKNSRSPQIKSKRGPWEIVQVREFSLDGKEQISLSPRARAHKELTIRTPSRVIKPKQKFDRDTKYDINQNPKGNQQFEFAGPPKKESTQITQKEYLAIINGKPINNK